MEKQQVKSIAMAEMMTPNMANFTGNVHGGYILSFLDKVAYACACRYAGTNIVTLSVDRVYFKEPVHVGELLTCKAMINYVGRTSMEVGVKVSSENLKTGEVRHTNTCYFTMVALDDDKKPAPLPELIINNDVEQRRFDEALIRRETRIRMYKEHLERKAQQKQQGE